MNYTKKVYPEIQSLAHSFAREILDEMGRCYNTGHSFHIMLAGGSTPKALFDALALFSDKNTPWNHVYFYWGDERCVGPQHPESNYGMAHNALLSRISVPPNNIQRMLGENEPQSEAERYQSVLMNAAIDNKGIPEFDLILLGMGDDGHTASLFPHRMELLHSDKLCEATNNPYSGQPRITVTPKLINNARKIVFMVTGQNKAEKVHEILSQNGQYKNYPASYIQANRGELIWLLDEDADLLISNE